MQWFAFLLLVPYIVVFASKTECRPSLSKRHILTYKKNFAKIIYIMSVKIKKILIDLKGVQIPWFPWKKTLRIPLQKKVTESGEKKEVNPGDEIVFDKIIQKDEEFGQPYLKGIKMVGEVAENGKNKKIFGMKYKSKKRFKRFWGHQEPYTEVKNLKVVLEENN